MSIQQEHFKDFFMSGCYIGKKEDYLFIAEEPKEFPDPFEYTNFMHLFNHNGQWESHLACHDIRLYGGYTSLPDAAWIMVSFFGSVLRIDKNGRNWEEDIPVPQWLEQIIISNARIIAGSLFCFIYAISTPTRWY